MQALRDYWNLRYKEINVQESGNAGYSLRYNRWYYKAKEQVLRESLLRLDIRITGKTIADIGTGTGFLIDFFMPYKPASVLGVDISEKSIDYLRQRYASESHVQFECMDVSHVSQISGQKFDVVTAYDLMYLFVSEQDFLSALQRICSVVANSGYLLIVDMFPSVDVRLGDYIVCRSVNTYRQILSPHGFDILTFVPQFFLFNRSGLGRVPIFLMNAFPWAVYAVDRIMLSLEISGDGNRSGASFKLLVARRNNAFIEHPA